MVFLFVLVNVFVVFSKFVLVFIDIVKFVRDDILDDVKWVIFVNKLFFKVGMVDVVY